MRHLALSFLALAATPALAQAPAAVTPSKPMAPPMTKTVMLVGPNQANRGTAVLTAAPKGVLVHVEATGLTPGWHGIHFHAKADCSDMGFKLSGGHVHATDPSIHGLLNPAATDAGDLPNIHAGADGKATAELFTTLVTLAPGGATPALLDADGSALVIHAKADDYMSQPIGGAGDRLVCGVIK